MKSRITSTIKLAIVVMIFLAPVIAVHADTITVTNTNDSGPGSLRQALADVNDGDTIDFAVTGTIGLTSGELLVNKSIIISGPGADNLAVDGNLNSRVFYVGPDATVIISDLTVTNGNATTDFGGGIYNDQSTLTLNTCNVGDNSADFGGGIYNYAGFGGATVTLNNSRFTDNSAILGGGIYTISGPGNAMVTVNNSTFSDNTTSFDGGGIYNYAASGGGVVTLNYSTLSGNSAGTLGGAGGGAIFNDGGGGDATVALNESTLSGNSASADGGGIHNLRGTLTISNSTLSGNVAVVAGGGIYNTWGLGNATLTLSNSTLSGNLADAAGGSIYNDSFFPGSALLEMAHTILNAASGGNLFNNGNGTITSLGYNLSSDDGGGYLTGPGDQINTDPLLGPLQDNGGPTFTHALLKGSPAIDAGDPNFTPPPLFDQRGPGFDRVVNGRIDTGSFEVQGPTPSPTPTPTATPTPSPTPRITPTPRSRPTPKARPTPLPHITPVPPPPSPRPTPVPRLSL